MPVVSHYACKEPPAEAVICRFMNFAKFRDLFASEELYFRRVDLFNDDDPWEALPSDEYVWLPHNVVVDPQGKVYVTDRDNERIEVFDSNGKFLIKSHLSKAEMKIETT
jgi:DNA-binding beta-propeller fold protein YncE